MSAVANVLPAYRFSLRSSVPLHALLLRKQKLQKPEKPRAHGRIHTAMREPTPVRSTLGRWYTAYTANTPLEVMTSGEAVCFNAVVVMLVLFVLYCTVATARYCVCGVAQLLVLSRSTVPVLSLPHLGPGWPLANESHILQYIAL